jgi:ParB-like chromosome segregation protein Spo0J
MAKASNGVGQRLVRKWVRSLKPMPENEMIYDPVDVNDPEFVEFAETIARRGCNPLRVTEDGYIADGHRRRLALQLNGQAQVSCLVLPVR